MRVSSNRFNRESISPLLERTSASYGHEAESHFDRLAQRFIGEILQEHPTLASAVGITSYDHLLPDFTQTGLAQTSSMESRWTATFEALSTDGLTPKEEIDRDLILMQLRKRKQLREWGEWRRSIEFYLNPALIGIYLPLLHRLDCETQLAEAVVARLSSLGSLLKSAEENLDPDLANPVLVARGAMYARSGAAYVGRMLPEEFNDPSLRARVRASGLGAAKNLEKFATFLNEFGQKARGDWRIGQDRYDKLLQQAEGLSYTADEVHRRGKVELERLREQFRGLALDIAGDANPRALVEEMEADAPGTAQEMCDAYRVAVERARGYCEESGLVGHSEPCIVEPAAPFLRALVPVAHYFPPPMLMVGRPGYLCVPYPPENAPADVVKDRLKLNNFAVIPSIAVHETYFGHHWHFTQLTRSSLGPSRKIFTSSLFGEGWAVYAEETLREDGYFTAPMQAAASIRGRLLRAVRMVADPLLHCGEMSVEEAAHFVAHETGLSAEHAKGEVERYCSSPTEAASYLLGALEIRRLRDMYCTQPGRTIQQFHEEIATTGILPIPLAERSLVHGKSQ